MDLLRRRTVTVPSAAAALLATQVLGGPAVLLPAGADGEAQRVIVLLEEIDTTVDEVDEVDDSGGDDAEVSAVSSPQVRALRAEAQEEVRERAAARGVAVEADHSWEGVVHGFSTTLDESGIATLREVPGVAAVLPDRPVQLDTATSVPLVGAPEVWEQTDAEGRSVTGAGTVVAVLDSGIDYTNPSLGGGFGESYKVVAGHDFANGDEDPMDDNGHGTHVAGIVAGDGHIQGVAPDASLTAYKVVDRDGIGYESDVIAGLEAAVAPDNPYRADVVNISLSLPGDGTDPLSLAATAATEDGVVVVASAGNAGPGERTVSSPAVAEGVISVGASTSGIRVPDLALTAPDSLPLQTERAGYSANPPETPVTGEVVDLGRGTPAEIEAAGDLEGRILLLRGNVSTSVEMTRPADLERARMFEEAGAVALVMYQPTSTRARSGEVTVTPSASGDDFRMDSLVVMGLRPLEYEQVTQRLAEGPVTARVSGTDSTDELASFSSRGPTGDHRLEPDLVAPGTEILSTWPTRLWEPGMFRLSGTSMAAPHVAGAAALLRQQHPEEDVDDVSARLIGTAHGLDGPGPAAQGAGRLDVAAATETDLLAEPTSVSFGLADMSGNHVEDSAEVTLHNRGDVGRTISLSTVAAEGSHGTVDVKPSRVWLAAGDSRTVTLSVRGRTPEERADLAGWLQARGNGGAASLRIPYQLSVRPVHVQASPSPAVGSTTVVVGMPAPAAEAPVLTVTPPRGRTYTVPTSHSHGTWYRAELTSPQSGVFGVAARGVTQDGTTVTGGSSVEFVDPGAGGSEWEAVGPDAEGGPVDVHPGDPDTLAVTAYGTLSPWFSSDGGDTWAQRPHWPVADGAGELVMHPQDPDTFWYAVSGSSGQLADPTYQGTVLRSTDGGTTWTRLAVPDAAYEHLLVSGDGGALVAVTATSILISQDLGDTWTEHPHQLGTGLTDVALHGEDLIALGYRDLWRVPDVTTGDPGPAEELLAEEPSFRAMVADDTMVAVLTSGNAVLGSTDAGASWSELFQGPTSGPWDLLQAGDDLVVTTYSGTLHIGSDHGTTWTERTAPARDAMVQDVARHGTDLIWSAPTAGMLRTDAEVADPRRIGVQGLTAQDLLITGTGEDQELLAATAQDIHRTPLPVGPVTPETTEWGANGAEGRVGRDVPFLAAEPGTDGADTGGTPALWRVQLNASGRIVLARSDGDGETWETRGTTSQVAHSFTVGPDGFVAVAFSNLQGSGLFATTDGGQTWRQHFHDRAFTAAAADPERPGRVWLGDVDGLYLSEDHGTTITRVQDGPVTAIEVSGDRVVAAGEEIAVSTDAGASFRTGDHGGPDTRVTDVVGLPGRENVLFAGTTQFTDNGVVKSGRGVLMSRNGGTTWTNVSGTLQNTAVESLAVSEDGRWLYAGTLRGGVHRVDVADLIGGVG